MKKILHTLLLLLLLFLAKIALASNDTTELRNMYIKAVRWNNQYPDSIQYVIEKIQTYEVAQYGAKWQGLTNFYLGSLYRRGQKIDSAIVYYNKAVLPFEQGNLLRYVAGTFNDLALCYRAKGDYEKNITYNFKALKIKEKVGNPKPIAASLMNLGTAYANYHKEKESIPFFIQAAEIYQSLSDTNLLTYSFVNLGGVYEILNKLDSATYYLEKGKQLSLLSSNEYNYASICHNLALVEHKKGNIKKALQYATIAYDIEEKLGLTYDLASLSTNMAELYYETKAYDKALSMAKKAFDAAEKEGLIEIQKNASRTLSKIHEKRQNWQQAHRYKTIEQSLNDSILSEETIKTIENLKIAYETEKKDLLYSNLQLEKERQAEALEKEKLQSRLLIIGLIAVALALVLAIYAFIEKKKRQKIAENNLKEKELLIREIHHRVKNNLQLMTSIMNVQIRQEKEAAIQKALLESQSRLKSMALVHQKLYGGEAIGKMPVDEYIEYLVENALQSFGNNYAPVNHKINAPNKEYHLNFLIPFGLIITELMINSFKYGFEGGKNDKLQIDITEDKEGLKVIYRDNGKGFEGRLKEGFGTLLIKSLLKKFNADIHYSGNKGFIATINFPNTHTGDKEID